MKNIEKCLADIKQQCEKHGTIRNAAAHYGVTHLAGVLSGHHHLTDKVARKFGWKVTRTETVERIK